MIKPLVLLHNDAMSLEVWRWLRPHLQQDHRLIAYDRRGHGKSETRPREAPYTVEVLVEDFRALQDGLETGQVDLFGCSGGARSPSLGPIMQLCCNPLTSSSALPGDFSLTRS